MGISTLSVRNNEDYIWKVTGTGLGTIVGESIRGIPIKNKYGELFFKPIISNYLNDVINKYGNPDFYVPLLKFAGYLKRKE